LIVDDDPAMLATAEAILSLEFDVTSCSGPLEALALFDATSFDVVCADFMMPVMDGRAFLAEIAKRSDVVCGLLMTARVDFEATNRPFPVLFKPFDPERFLHTINHLARLSEMKRSARALNRAADGVAAARGPRRF
jgi:DNA-binding NtrC family response regulator